MDELRDLSFIEILDGDSSTIGINYRVFNERGKVAVERVKHYQIQLIVSFHFWSWLCVYGWSQAGIDFRVL